MRSVTRTLLALVLVVIAAVPLSAQRRSDVITADEIERARPHVGTAYDAVQALRPRWLRAPEAVMSSRRPENQVEAAQLHVYLDDVDAGGVDYLKTILAERVQELRWLSANQASSRYGPTDGGPAIVVTLKR
jgi:hypothetical protein